MGDGNPGGGLLFGHRTYEMMKFWSTPQGAEMMPEVARYMDELQKYVVSHAPFEPGWSNVQVVSGDVVGEIRKIRQCPAAT